MLPGHRAPRGFSLLAGVLISAFLLQGFLAIPTKSPVFDETGDIAAGLAYVQTGEVHANLQHPPLLKELAGASLWAAGIRLPESPDVAQRLAAGAERAVGSELIAANGPDRTMWASRLPFLLLAASLGALLYLWGRRLVGEAAALAALFLYTLDPTILGHAYLATVDVGLAAFTLLFFYALWAYVQAPNAKCMVGCGMALGLLMSTKFSAVFLLPVVALVLLAAVRRPPTKTAAESTFLRGYMGAASALLMMGLLATFVIQALYLSPGGLFLYATGLQRVNADHNPDYLVFLGGQLQHNFATYFAAAYLLKEPIAAIALAAIGVFAIGKSDAPLAEVHPGRDRQGAISESRQPHPAPTAEARQPHPAPIAEARGFNPSRDRQGENSGIRLTSLTKLFLLLPPLVIFAAHMAFADNLGVRYIIPALPFLYLIGGLGAAWLIRKGTGGLIAAGVLALWLLVTSIGVAPDHLSYFNEAACLGQNQAGIGIGAIGIDGGTRCGPLWLDDSNVDWGQGLKQLKQWADRNAKGRPIRLAYFGSFPPAAYGVEAQAIGIDDLMRAPAPGLYVVSAHFVARLPPMGAAGEWLRRTTPTAIVGHAMYVYDIGGTTR